MYEYKVYLQGPLGYRAVYFTTANSRLEAEATMLKEIKVFGVKVLRTECLTPNGVSGINVTSIHNVISVDFKNRRRVYIST